MASLAAADELRRRCEQVLRDNWREGTRAADGIPFAYTRPSTRHYPWQFYWDSCFTAIVWRRFDPQRARRELESLLVAQEDDGFIGHTIFWDHPLTGVRRHTYNILRPGAPMTASIQPPLLAWAWRLAVGDPAAEPRIARHHEWLAAHRDLDGDGLIWIVQPDESGMDASPMFDPIWGHRAHGLAGFPLLVHRNRHLGYDLRRIARAGGPVCCEVTTNVLYNLSRQALGLPSLTETLIERTYDRVRGLFAPLARPLPRRPPATTIAALTPLALPDLPPRDRPPAGHRAPAQLRRVLVRGAAAVGVAGGPELLAARHRRPAPASLLARPHLGQRGVAVLAGPGAAGLRGTGRRAGTAGRRRGGPLGPARVLRPALRGGHGRSGVRLVDARAGDARRRLRRDPRALRTPSAPLRWRALTSVT